MSSRSSAPAHPWRRPLLIVGGLLLVVVALGVLALPFRHAPSAAESAKADLESAKTALSGKDFDRAAESVESARRHTDDVQDAMQGFGGDVWSLIPFHRVRVLPPRLSPNSWLAP